MTKTYNDIEAVTHLLEEVSFGDSDGIKSTLTLSLSLENHQILNR